MLMLMFVLMLFVCVLQSCLLESPSGHQHGLSRFAHVKPRAAGSSSGGSASSTPHSLACPGSSASTPQLQPHPPQARGKTAKPPVAAAGGPGANLSSGAAQHLASMDCGSPVDSPRMTMTALAPGGSSGGCETPGSSVRRGRYSQSGAVSSSGGPDGMVVVGSLGSTSSGALFGTSSGRASGLVRSSSGFAGTDSSNPTSPVPNLAPRAPSSGGGAGGYPLGRSDPGSLSSMGSGPVGYSSAYSPLFAAAATAAGAPISRARDSSSGGVREGSSGGVAPLLGGRDSYSGGGGGVVLGSSPAAVRSPRSSFAGSGTSSSDAANAAAAAATAAAAIRPSSGKKAVCLLVDAIHSGDDTQLMSLLQHYVRGVHGIKDRHPATHRYVLRGWGRPCSSP
jgi:hypothetical protein